MTFKKSGWAFLAALIGFGAQACGNDPESSENTVPLYADTIYENGSIWTGVADAPHAEAMAIVDGGITAIGANAGMDELRGPDTRIIDFDGAFVVPGFIDNHTHFLAGGFGLASVNLRDAATPEEFAKRIGDFAKTQPAGRWIRFGDWDHELWGGELPDREWIDAATPDNPVFVSRLDGHMALANSLAIELAGIPDDAPDPQGGEIVRDESGRMIGVFKDTAMALFNDAIPPFADEEYDAAFAAAADQALARGVTQIHDMSLLEGEWVSLEAFRRSHARGDFPLRVYSFVALSDWQKLAEFVEANGRGDDWLRWGGLKGFVDGSLGSTTAWFYEPYDDAPETNGFALSDLDELKADLIGADAAGLHVTIHAIGDQANDWLLDAFEAAGSINGGDIKDRRFRIEHTQHLSADAIARFEPLGVIASMQPYHAIDDGRWAEKRIGAERIKRTYAFRSLLDAGAHVTFGSDWTVAPIDPLLGIYAGVTRQTTDGANPGGWVPEEKITVEEALRAYTSANAYAGFQEEKLGTLEAGKLADFVVLSDDLFEIDADDIDDVRVLRTVISGEDKFVGGE